MPRRKQSNPQPVKCDYEEGIAGVNPDTLVLESNLLLGQDLGFGDADFKIVGFDRDCAAGDMGMAMYSLSDEECGSYKQLSLGSDVEDRPDPSGEDAFRPRQTCAVCGDVLERRGQSLCRHCGALNPSGPGRRASAAAGTRAGRCVRPTARQRPLRRSKAAKAPNRSSPEAPGEGDAPKSFSCQLCSFTSRYSNHLKRHMKTHNGEKPYQCPFCPYASAQLVNLQRHTRTHTGEKPYKCTQCPFACSSLGNLRRHQRMHAEERPHTCGQCSYRASSGLSLKRHMATHKSNGCDARDSATEEGVVSDLMLCISSSDDFLHSYGSLEQDRPPSSLLEPEPEQPSLFPCGLDEEPASPVNGHPASDRTPLKEDPQSPKPQTPTSGPSDPGDSPSPKAPERVYTCPSCPFTSCYPNHLVRHRKTHSGEKPYRCPDCSYASAHLDNLKRHLRVHTGEKPYACACCDYACGNLANLRRHERIHTGAKPFQCSQCPYSCNQSMNLKRHMLRHSGQKPHCCPLCSYTTGHWDNYKRHQKKHAGGGDGEGEDGGGANGSEPSEWPKQEQEG